MLTKYIILVLFVAVLFVSGCVQQQNPFELMKQANQKQTGFNYIIEYSVETERVIDSNPSVQEYREVFYKSSDKIKNQVIVEDSVRHETIKNELGVFVCTYFAQDDILCISVPDSGEIYNEDALKTLFDGGVIKSAVSEKELSVEGEKRKCNNIELYADLASLTQEKFKVIDNALGIEGGEYETSIIKEIRSSLCLDEETGVLLGSRTFTRFDAPYLDGVVDVSGSLIKTATKLTTDPDFGDMDFQVPENAAIEEFPKDSV